MLPPMLGLEPRTVVRLGALGKQRNLTEYTGDVVPEAIMADCLAQAEALLATTIAWPKAHKPDLL